MKSSHQVTLIKGDGIGQEVILAARRLIESTGVRIDWLEAEAGAVCFRKGIASGVPRETVDAIERTRVVLKGPLETPVGYGEKSANVTLRKLFETYGNLRPVREIPGVKTPYSDRGIDLVIVRENVEDLYAGIEHMQTPTVAQCLKLISRKGCEKIARLGFELARAEGRKTVHCATKANIMKLTEGLLKRTFEEVAKEYPEIKSQHIIIDNCAHQLVKKPEQFEVIVTTNMNGDIISDLTSALIGGLGFAPSANIGNEVAIFEAVHGSAPKYAGKDVINPTAMILSGVLMLRHLGEFEAAQLVENAVLATLESGKATRDTGVVNPLGTVRFTEAVLENFGTAPRSVAPRKYRPVQLPRSSQFSKPKAGLQRETVGMDVFIESSLSTEMLGKALDQLAAESGFKLKMISNRGTKVYPATGAWTDTVDQWRCRFMAVSCADEIPLESVSALLTRIEASGLRWMHIEKLQQFDGSDGFTKAQGED